MFNSSVGDTVTTTPSDCRITEAIKTLVEPTPARVAVSQRRAVAVAGPRAERGRATRKVMEEVGMVRAVGGTVT